MENEYKKTIKEINIILIITCWIVNLTVMFTYPPIAIFISNLLEFLIVNLIVFIVWKVVE